MARVTTPIWRCSDLLWIVLNTNVLRVVHTTQVLICESIEIWQWCRLHHFSDLLLKVFNHSVVIVVVNTVHTCSVLVQWSKLADEVKVP